MIRSTYLAFVCLLLLLLSSACSKPAENSASGPAPGASPAREKVTSESVVSVAPLQTVELPVGGSAETVVTVTIKNGYHTNANPPTYSYLKATELNVTAADGVSAEPTTYPRATLKKFPFADQPLAVYEGATVLKAKLQADKAARPGQRSLSAVLRIQACDDQVCYPPGKLEVAIPINVK